MRRGSDFSRAVSNGSRAGSRRLVVHVAQPHPVPADTVDGENCPTHTAPVRVGFVVSKAVGGAVERNVVKRRLRELMRSYLQDFPAGSLAVIRALPAARGSSNADLATDLRHALAKARRRWQ
ncbi:MAG: ribonuclease P protein component [Beutenbergiaceae bacterium]